MTPNEANALGIRVNADGQKRNLLQLLSYDTCSRDKLEAVWPELKDWSDSVFEQIEIDALYSGYLGRQAAEIDAFRKDENLALPEDLDYALVGGLSNEAREKLSRVRPLTLGQARRIEGMTPGALTALLFHVRNLKKGAA